MSSNSFGQLLRFTTWGESHGKAIGVIIDGLPSGIPLSRDMIQQDLDRRRPGQSKVTTQRSEADRVEILSGLWYKPDNPHQWLTTGAPLSLQIQNNNTKSEDYDEVKTAFRPGHADYTLWQKFGIRDPRGGGRSSARETACRVAAGAVAKQLLKALAFSAQEYSLSEISAASRLGVPLIRAGLIEMGEKKLSPQDVDWQWVEKAPQENPLFLLAGPETQQEWTHYLQKVRKSGDSVGGKVLIQATHIPPGLGEPYYQRLDALLGAAFLSIHAVKAVSFGEDRHPANSLGSEAHDALVLNATGQTTFASNTAGGILGGISSGQPILSEVTFKATSSILHPQPSLNQKGEELASLRTKGRHDPCVAIRGVPVVEAMMAFTLADLWMIALARNQGHPLGLRPWDS